MLANLAITCSTCNHASITDEHRFQMAYTSTKTRFAGDTMFDGSRANKGQVITNMTRSSNSSTLQVQVTAIHIDQAEFPLSRLLFRLTLELAREVVQKRLKSRGVKVLLNVRSANTCSRQYAGAVAAEEYYTKRARLFIVSGCDDAIRGVSRLASSWRVPVMTAAGFGADLNDKLVHKTLIRVAFSLRSAVEFLHKILKSFQWRRVNLIVDESDANSWALKKGIEQQLLDYGKKNGDFQVLLNAIALDLQSLTTDTGGLLLQGNSTTNMSSGSVFNRKRSNITANFEDKWPNHLTESAVRDALRQSSLFSRVNILLIPQRYLRKFMLSVHEQNMANGLYTFINMPLLLLTAADEESGANTDNDSSYDWSNKTGVKGNYTKQQNYQQAATGENVFVWRSLSSSRNAQAKQAFESLMSIFIRAPTSKAYIYFASSLSSLANSEAANSSTAAPNEGPSRQLMNSRNLAEDTKVQLNINPYSASFYDCLQIYGNILDQSLAAIETESDPKAKSKLKADLHASISKLLRNRRFENMVTGTILINDNGDRDTDYTLDDLNQMTGKYAPVIVYKGESREIERLGRIHWSSDESIGPTIDNVDCRLTDTCPSKPMSKFLVTLSLLVIPLGMVMGSVLYFVYSRIAMESQLVDYWWKINYKEIEIVLTRRKAAGDGSSVATGADSQVSSTHGGAEGGKSAKSGDGVASEPGKTVITKVTNTSGFASTAADVCYGEISLGLYKLSKVALKPISKFYQSRKLMIELRTVSALLLCDLVTLPTLILTNSLLMKHHPNSIFLQLKGISHNNLCRFVGIVVDEANTALVSEFCPKGSLREFFQNESMVIDWTFKYSIINDIMAGLSYLHSSPIEFHGRLKSSNCLVSSRFVVKLSDYGLHSLYDHLDGNEDEMLLIRKQLWRAPEHMKLGPKKCGSKKGDVYSFGLLLYEIITNNLPFYDSEKDDYVMPLKILYNELKSNGPTEKTGPNLSIIDTSENDIEPLIDLMKQCWQHDIGKRPSSLVVSTALRKITRGVTSKKLLENLTSRMEQYTNNLESLVDGKLATLVEEKLKTEELLYQFVPKSIASMLKEGETVEPEAFECVTVLFSDIVGFTSLSSESTPIEVIDFLSELYLCFDETLSHYDIFKVETIGDAYIVASGLPQRNEGRHVLEIAQAALELRERLSAFKIPHKPGRSLQMRVGIHSGPCVAGIVGGLNMPKYCVFGDTLSLGKYMESSGLPMKIQLTEESKNLLSRIGGFKIEPRTPKIVKDGSPMQTYWLEGSTNV